jgi:hypothetical protein
MSFFPPRWRNKIRRRFYSPYNKLAHRGRYFICRYFGAEFLVRSANVGGLEISAKIAEYPELKNFMRSAAAIKPDIFIDVGANLGLGLSQIVETAPQGQGQGSDVEVVRFDDFVALTGQALAIKIDVERYERKVLAGMARTLRDNRGTVQIEVLEAREETTALMTAAGFRLAQDFGPNLVFRKD